MNLESSIKDAEKNLKRRAYKWSILIIVIYIAVKITLYYTVGKENSSLIIISAIIIILILLLLFKSMKITKDNERLVLFHLGKYVGIRGPGIVMMIPFIDLVVRVDLDLNIPDWKLLSDVELETKLKSIVINVHDNIIKK